jgi:hypothetical protein
VEELEVVSLFEFGHNEVIVITTTCATIEAVEDTATEGRSIAEAMLEQLDKLFVSLVEV